MQWRWADDVIACGCRGFSLLHARRRQLVPSRQFPSWQGRAARAPLRVLVADVQQGDAVGLARHSGQRRRERHLLEALRRARSRPCCQHAGGASWKQHIARTAGSAASTQQHRL